MNVTLRTMAGQRTAAATVLFPHRAMPGPKAPEGERREQILRAAYTVALRAGIDGVTLRAVAAEASLSHGLVAFHFGRKDALVDALLDRVLTTTGPLRDRDDETAPGQAPAHLRTLLHDELDRIAANPPALGLLLEYWALGTRRTSVRAKIARAIERYRAAVRHAAQAALRDRAPDAVITADGVAALAVSLVTGYAMQAVLDPKGFDRAAYLTAVSGMLAQVGAG